MTARTEIRESRVGGRHPVPLRVLTGHALRAFVRNPVAAFFTLAFPLAFLVIVASIVGDQDAGNGIPVAQYLVSPFAVFGVAQASFVLIAIDTARLRDSGVLLRLRATPIPPWTVLSARIGASLVISGAGVALLTAVGVLGYDVRIVGRKVPALLVTLLAGIGCCAALGVALASLCRTVAVAQALSQGLLISLAFISDVFIVGADLPRGLELISTALPLKHFAQAMSATFEPGPGYGFSPVHLAVLAAWAVAGAVVARTQFSWQPDVRTPPAPPPPDGASAPGVLSPPAPRAGRSPLLIVSGQIGYAVLGLRRDPLSVFFSVVFPALLLALFPTVFGDAPVSGTPMAHYLFAGMITYATAVAAYVDVPEGVVGARAAGVLKRLRGTPLPLRGYFAGRVSAALIVALIATAMLAVVGLGFLGVRLDAARLPALLLAIAAGSVCFAALGLAVAALMPSAHSIVAVTLGTLLPLCFVSGVFVVGDRPLPGWLTTVADLLPLRHLMRAVLAATEPAAAGYGFTAGHLAVLAGWAAAALLVVWRRRAALAGSGPH
ncbi:ABC transporter permease [Actinoplanes sp. NPDC023714]|uniref:ABC transporter permease n=1 Tax=Actinoplanes sp. NPDC023714 TaxID=3154322 RepID=UPI0033EDC3A1